MTRASRTQRRKTGLSVLHRDMDSFRGMLRFALESVGVSQVHHSIREPQPGGAVSLSPVARFDLVLSGRKRIAFSSGGRTREIVMSPGEALFSPPLCWKWPLWDLRHEMTSTVFYPGYVHITYIDYRELSDYYDTHAADIFFDTDQPISPAGQALVQAMSMQSERDSGVGLTAMTKALIEITVEMLERPPDGADGKARDTWRQVCGYVRENFRTPINRAHVAKMFGLNPSYLSRLFRAEGGEGFTGMLRRLRMEHAALLLQNTRMGIKEVSRHCGYGSSTFFIGAFRGAFGISPGKFRRQHVRSGDGTRE